MGWSLSQAMRALLEGYSVDWRTDEQRADRLTRGAMRPPFPRAHRSTLMHGRWLTMSLRPGSLIGLIRSATDR